MLRLGGLESSENLTSSLPRQRCLRLGIRVSSKNINDQFWPFSSELFQPKHTILKQNHKTNLNQPKNTCIENLGFS